MSSLFFGRAAPTIAVADLDRALAFYVGVLGMTKTFTNGSPPAFAIVKRDEAEIHLARSPGHRGGAANVLHLLVSDATALHARCVAGGATIVKPLRDHDYGMRAFVVADPDGNRLDVGQNLN
jgi:catechol 2,3-dioxygenase-like lactoylglutathione lyase family enzyme